MALQWNVQPYRWLYELRDNYTVAIFDATQRSAPAYAKEMTEWMKENAPWEDRTGAARKGLRAELIQPLSDAEMAKEGELKRKAIREDAKLLKEINRERKKDEAIPLSRVPEGRSAVVKFEKRLVRKLPPVVRIWISHDQRLPYALWLEIANQGRYAIISRTLDYWTPKILARVRSNANLVQYRGRQEFSEALRPPLSEEEAFVNYVAAQENLNGKPYQPWSKAIQTRRAERRTYRRKGPQKRGRYNTQQGE